MKLLTRLLVLLVVLCSIAKAADAPRPNILFIIFDDWAGSMRARMAALG